MKWLQRFGTALLIPAVFAVGFYGAPFAEKTYRQVFPADEYRNGNFSGLYAEANRSVVLFSTSTCPYCRKAREFFAEHGIAYTDYVVDQSKAAEEKFSARGGGAVPLIYIGDREIRGFRETAVREALAAAGVRHP